MILPHKLKLGKKPAVFLPTTPRLTAVLARALPEPPDSVNYGKNLNLWKMWKNDTIGCCTSVSTASAIRVWTAASQSQIELSDDQVLENYSLTTGYDPRNPATDQGGVVTDVLNIWCKTGLSSHGQTRDYLTMFGYINPKNHDSAKRAIAMLGVLYVGIVLPNYALQTDSPWTVQTANNAPAGGHAICVWGYDSEYLYFNTWGINQKMTWEFFDMYADEAYGLLSRLDWLDTKGYSPAKEDFNTLSLELQESLKQ